MVSFCNRKEWSTNPLQLTSISPKEVKLIQSTWISAGHRPGTFGNLTSQDFREGTLKNTQCPAPEHYCSHLHFRQFLRQVWCQFSLYFNIFFLIPGTYCFLVPVNIVSLWCKLWFHSLSAYLIRVSWTWEAGRFIWCPLLFSKTWIFHNRHGKMDICLVSFLLPYGDLFQFQELQYLITCLANIWFVLLLFSAILPFLLLLKTGLKVLGVSRQELTWIYTVSE